MYYRRFASLFFLRPRLLSLVLGGLLLNACAGIRLDVSMSVSDRKDAAIIAQQADAFPEREILAINDEIIDYLNTHVTDRSSDRVVVERLRELLFDLDYLNIHYEDERTRTAIEAFESRRGNCLSVVNLYIAMARYLNVDAKYQTVRVRPRWDRRGEVLVLSQHINATGRLGQRVQYVVDFAPEIVVQQLTSSVISDRQARALYFNNLGVEELIVGNLEPAILYFRNSLWIDKELSIAWSNLGATFYRSGDAALAEYAYQKAFSVDDSNATAISNLVKLYTKQGDMERATRYAKAIERFNNRNPYFHFSQGSLAYNDGDFEVAAGHFKQAIRRKDVEPEFYLALADAYKQIGDEQGYADMILLARYVITVSQQIYLPSQNKVRFVDSDSILRSTSPGVSIRANPK
jgi:tetratricopeptide (TPR) repeat protein